MANFLCLLYYYHDNCEGEMQVLELETIDSTNLYAKNNFASLSDSSVIHALRQSSGRGRFDRKWVDLGEGNLFLSIVLKPSLSYMDSIINITQYMSVVLSNLFESYGLIPQIKWPNDVLINNKKIAGILCEVINEKNEFKGLVLGVGVNLNALDSSLGLVTDKSITSLNLEISRSIDIFSFREQLLSMFFENYNLFLENGFEFIKKDYISKLMMINKEISIQVFNEIKSGFVKGVTDSGELVLENDNKEYVLSIGDIL